MATNHEVVGSNPTGLEFLNAHGKRLLETGAFFYRNYRPLGVGLRGDSIGCGGGLTLFCRSN